MAIPNQTFNILSNGIGGAVASSSALVIVGPANRTTTSVGDVVAVGTPAKAKELFGYSPLGEAAAFCSSVAGTIYAIEVPAVITALNDAALTKVGAGSGTITVDGYADFDFDFKIKIVSPTEYVFTLDGYNYSQESRKIVTTGDLTIPNSGLTVSFTGVFTAGDIYSKQLVGPKIATGNLDDAFLKIQDYPVVMQNVFVYDGLTSASSATLSFGTLKGELVSAANKYKWMRAIMDFGSTEPNKATVVTAIGTVECDRISPVCDAAQVFSALQREGFVVPKLGLVVGYAADVATALISEDPGQVNRGSVVGIYKLENDEAANPRGLDAAKIVTGRKLAGVSGIYITHSHLNSTVGSDFRYIQHGRVMDEACRVAYAAQAQFLLSPVRVTNTGSISFQDKAKFEGPVNAALQDALLAPINSAGTKGHVSALSYFIDDSNNILTTETLITTITIRPLGYIGSISTTIGFSVNV